MGNAGSSSSFGGGYQSTTSASETGLSVATAIVARIVVESRIVAFNRIADLESARTVTHGTGQSLVEIRGGLNPVPVIVS